MVKLKHILVGAGMLGAGAALYYFLSKQQNDKELVRVPAPRVIIDPTAEALAQTSTTKAMAYKIEKIIVKINTMYKEKGSVPFPIKSEDIVAGHRFVYRFTKEDNLKYRAKGFVDGRKVYDKVVNLY